MIKEISVENFKSIKERITLDLEASGHNKRHMNNVSKENILKSSAIFGPNASGKSNFIKAIAFMQDMIINSHKHNIDDNIPRTPFKFNKTSRKKPSSIEIVFHAEGNMYKYGFSCNEKEFLDEYLFTGKNLKRLIFERKNTNEYKFSQKMKTQEHFKKTMTHNVLFLSRSTSMGNPHTKDAYLSLKKMILGKEPNDYNYTANLISSNRSYKNKILSYLKETDMGGIDGIMLKEGKRLEWKVPMRDGMPDKSELKEVMKDSKEVFFSHKSGNSFENLKFDEESDGTQKFFKMAGFFLETIEKGGVLLIDEIDSSMHPKIIKHIVSIFNNSRNKEGQLIFTTHNTELMDQNMFRKDQIYIFKKEPNSGTRIDSLEDYEFREDRHNFSKIYMEGRVGGLPFIKE